MKHLQAEKYNLAWFRLAECVSRREKERALGVYRLLSHSLGDRALAAQLYGDLLICFGDDCAIEKYLEAAQLYKKSKKIIEAIAVYEHLIFLDSTSKDYFFEILELYKILDLQDKMVPHVKRLIKENKVDIAIGIVKKIETSIKRESLADLNKSLVFLVLKSKSKSPEEIEEQIKRTIDSIIDADNSMLLQEFLSELKSINVDYYLNACCYIEDK